MTQHPRGSLLVIALMVILVLAGLGLIAVRNVMMEHSQVGNFRAGEQALNVTDAGLASVMALAVSRGDAFPAFVQANSNTLNMTDAATQFFDVTKDGSFGREFVNIGGVNFQTVLTAPADTNRVPGYPVSDQYIWKKYKMTTTGFYGDQQIKPSEVDSTLRNSTRRFVSFSYVGPYIINGGGQ